MDTHTHDKSKVSTREKYSIKDMVTPELKRSMAIAINKGGEKMKEIGFSICKDSDTETRKLFAGNMCEGDNCSISFKGSSDICYELGDGIQGDFHTHNHVKKFNMNRIKEGKKILPYSDVRKDYKSRDETSKQLGFDIKPSLVLASHSDLLTAIDDSCRIKGYKTMCVGSDIAPDNVECWHIKTNMITKEICSRAKEELKPENLKKYKEEDKNIFRYALKPWTIPLFEREIIKLRK